MRALTVRQPFASLIATGTKTIELRSWSTAYRGPLLVTSGTRRHVAGREFQDGPLGVTICLVDLVEVRCADARDTAAACAPAEGLFAWVLANPRTVRSCSVKGRLGLWRPAEHLLRECAIP